MSRTNAELGVKSNFSGACIENVTMAHCLHLNIGMSIALGRSLLSYKVDILKKHVRLINDWK